VNDRELLYVYWIILSVFVFISLSMLLAKAANDEIFKEKAMLSDLAITFDSIISSPTDITVEKNLGPDRVSLDNNCKFFAESESKKVESISYSCLSTKSIQVQSFSGLTGNICITKIGDKVLAKNCAKDIP